MEKSSPLLPRHSPHLMLSNIRSQMQWRNVAPLILSILFLGSKCKEGENLEERERVSNELDMGGGGGALHWRCRGGLPFPFFPCWDFEASIGRELGDVMEKVTRAHDEDDDMTKTWQLAAPIKTSSPRCRQN